MRFLALFSLILVTALAQSPEADPRPRAPGPRPEEDQSNVTPKRAPDRVLVFKQTPQGDLTAHVYFPPGWTAHDRRPAIVFWVGGGFRAGRIGQFSARADYFASRGLVTVCAEYRGRDSHGIELDSCAEDARSAMRWVKGQATNFGIDPDKVVGGGGSAGGTMALLAARTIGPDAPDDNLVISPRPAALLLFNPAVGEHVLQVVGWGGPAQAAINAQIQALDTPQSDEPPSILFFGTEDHEFLTVSSRYHRAVRAQGTRSQLWIATGMGHGFFNNQPWHDATTLSADNFLVTLGLLSTPATLKPDPAAVLTLAGPDYTPPLPTAKKIQKIACDLPALPVTEALQKFTQQSGFQVVIAANAPLDATSQAVQGEFSVPRPVFDRMLSGTGLIATRDRTTGIFVISRAQQPVNTRAEIANAQQRSP